MGPSRRVRPFGRSGVEAPTADEAARFDRTSIDGGVPESALMENAGRQAALLIHHLYPTGPVVALVGSGNNGGDALVCLRALAAWGRPVAAVTVGERPAPDPVVHGWDLHVVPYSLEAPSPAREALAGATVIVDGLLGTGIRGAPRPLQQGAIADANGRGRPIVALDAPSGVDGSTGAVPGASIRADVTVAFGWPKLGTILYPGRERCGRIIAVEIGFPPRAAETWATLLTPGWVASKMPARPPVTHKNAVGALALVAGSSMPGAAILAARAAFRCGIGLVRVCARGSARDAILSAVPEVLFVDGDDAGAVEAAVTASGAVAMGPGLGRDGAASALVDRVLGQRGARPAVLDADALTLLAEGKAGGLDALGDGVVVTPHPGEMGRLVSGTATVVQDDRVGTARAFARARGVVTLLKGAPSLVAGTDGDLLLATVQDPSELAVAGMGDVLTGAIGSFLGQGAEPFDAAGLGLATTGWAAAFAGLGPSLVPSDVVAHLSEALAPTGPGTTDLPFPFVTFDQDGPGTAWTSTS